MRLTSGMGVDGMDGGGNGRRGSGVSEGIADCNDVSNAMDVSTMLSTMMAKSRDNK